MILMATLVSRKRKPKELDEAAQRVALAGAKPPQGPERGGVVAVVEDGHGVIGAVGDDDVLDHLVHLGEFLASRGEGGVVVKGPL